MRLIPGGGNLRGISSLRLLDRAKTEFTSQNSSLVQRVQPVSAAEISKNQHGSKSSVFIFSDDGESGVFGWVIRVRR